MSEPTEQEKRRHGLLLDMTVEAMGSPGIVVNADLAARTKCRCYSIDGELCFSKGVVGALSKSQVEAYCPTKEMLTEGIARRVKLFREAAKEAKKEIAGIPKGERLEPWLHAMSKSLRKRGIEI